ncbi:F-box-like domain-containing protein [Legionella drozanskii]|uniref:Ankyrin repeats (3 copies) n=1 Tax=Legionella drozanskii LLAP-1 TaxID=1212489 RepID=A0A0W0SXL8_9GAMM|nr:F-box-like domain-containing protein [Legionella drozanskii]KTC88065.1 Ankyrin repeats (3 copies) [Legionella drozanskii LLAP-1]
MKEPIETTTVFTSQPPDLPELPDEVWLHILSFLDPESLIKSVELVNLQFSNFANDAWIWKQLFHSYFSQEIPSPLPKDFNWKKEFITLYTEQYGFLKAETRKLIALIVVGNIDTIRTLNISIKDLKADSQVLIKTATRLNQQAILEHFYSISEQKFQTKTEGKNKLELLRWAVLRNRGQGDENILRANRLAAEAGLWDLVLELLNSPENPILLNDSNLRKLRSAIICSEQMYMLRAFDEFIANYNSSNPMEKPLLPINSNLHEAIEIAASEGSMSMFSRFNNQLHQELDRIEQNLNEAITSSSSSDTIEAHKKKLEEAKALLRSAMASAMGLAVKHGHTALVKYALENKLIGINETLNHDNTLLSCAISSEQFNMLSLLLDNQADPEPALSVGISNLIYSSSSQRAALEKMVFALLDAFEKGGKITNIKALEAATGGRLDILKRLFDLDQGRFIKTNTIQTLLKKYCIKNCRAFLEEQLEAKTKETATPLAPSVATENLYRFHQSPTPTNSQSTSVDQQEKKTKSL